MPRGLCKSIAVLIVLGKGGCSRGLGDLMVLRISRELATVSHSSFPRGGYIVFNSTLSRVSSHCQTAGSSTGQYLEPGEISLSTLLAEQSFYAKSHMSVFQLGTII